MCAFLCAIIDPCIHFVEQKTESCDPHARAPVRPLGISRCTVSVSCVISVAFSYATQTSHPALASTIPPLSLIPLPSTRRTIARTHTRMNSHVRRTIIAWKLEVIVMHCYIHHHATHSHVVIHSYTLLTHTRMRTLVRSHGRLGRARGKGAFKLTVASELSDDRSFVLRLAIPPLHAPLRKCSCGSIPIPRVVSGATQFVTSTRTSRTDESIQPFFSGLLLLLYSHSSRTMTDVVSFNPFNRRIFFFSFFKRVFHSLF